MSKDKGPVAILPIQGAPSPWRFAVIEPSMTITSPDVGTPDVPMFAVVSFHEDTMSAYNAAIERIKSKRPW